MNLIGEKVEVLDSTDPTKKGRSGEVVLETARTLQLESANGRFYVEKAGAVFLIAGSKDPILGDDLAGRLEGRLGRRRN